METQNQAGYTLIGTATVARDKLEDTVWIDVFPIEQLPTLSGDYNEKENIKVLNEDASKSNINKTVERSKTIKAKWLNLYNSNRESAPDVVAGEKVHIFQAGGEDIYYWASYATSLRKREKVLFSFSNKEGSNPNGENGLEEYYFLVDTRNKEIILHTADNDGEASLYDFILNTKLGEYTVRDLQGNYFHLESVMGRFSTHINETIQADTKNTILNSADTITSTTQTHVINNSTQVTNTSGQHVINVGSFDVYKGGESLIQILIDWLQTDISEVHINSAGPTTMTGGSVAAHQGIIDRLNKLKAGSNNNTGLTYQEPDDGSPIKETRE